MKKTSKEFMEWLGLSIGDRIKVEDVVYTINNLYILESFVNATNQPFAHYECVHISILVRDDVEYEILPRPKRVGDLKCDDYEGCDYGCPLMWLCCNAQKEHNCDITLYNVLDFYEIDDQEIYDLLKTRLDKELKQDE